MFINAISGWGLRLGERNCGRAILTFKAAVNESSSNIINKSGISETTAADYSRWLNWE
jgi:hypothetical protein